MNSKELLKFVDNNKIILIIIIICLFFSAYSLTQLKNVQNKCNENWINNLEKAGLLERYENGMEVHHFGNQSYINNSKWQFGNS